MIESKLVESENLPLSETIGFNNNIDIDIFNPETQRLTKSFHCDTNTLRKLCFYAAIHINNGRQEGTELSDERQIVHTLAIAILKATQAHN